MNFKWVNGFIIKTTLQNRAFLISANKEGLLSLARHLIALANNTIPDFHHFHLDDSNSLEEGSLEIVFEKTPTIHI